MPTITSEYETFAHRYAKETGKQLDPDHEAMFYAGARAALHLVKHGTDVDDLVVECIAKTFP